MPTTTEGNLVSLTADAFHNVDIAQVRFVEIYLECGISKAVQRRFFQAKNNTVYKQYHHIHSEAMKFLDYILSQSSF